MPVLGCSTAVISEAGSRVSWSSCSQLKQKINEEFSDYSLCATGAAAVWVPCKKGGKVSAQSTSPRGGTMETLPGRWLEAGNSL